MDQKDIHSYHQLFTVTLLFPSLSTVTLITYTFVRGSLWEPFEPLAVAICLCVFLSALGQRLSKIKKIGAWIFYISGFCALSSYEVFASTRIVGSSIFFSLMLAFVPSGYPVWGTLNELWEYLCRKEITRGRILVVGGSGVLAVLLVFSIVTYLVDILHFFDSHPWAMTLVGAVITLLGGILIGRKTKK